MKNITYFDLTDSITEEVIHWVTIDRGNGEFTSMPKAVYDAQQVEHLTEIPTPDEA